MRIRKKQGDIFEVILQDKIRYFQFLYTDIEYLNGDVIRAFNYSVGHGEKVELGLIINSGIDFIVHTWLYDGVKLNLWNRIGNIPIESTFEFPIFRQTNEIGSPGFKSTQWFVWQQFFNNQTFIGELTDETRKLPFSRVLPPEAIIEWLDKGNHGRIHPI